MDQSPINIATLQVQNTLGVKAAHLVWDKSKNALVIGGENGAGKSSLCDAIWIALGGKPTGAKIIHQGTAESVIQLDMADAETGQAKLTIKRKTKLNADGEEVSTLTVTSPDGAIYKSPQALLNTLTSKWAFDPLQFLDLPPAEQFNHLTKAIGFDAKPYEVKHKVFLAQISKAELQTEHFKGAAARIAGYYDFDTVPDEKVSMNELQATLAKAKEQEAEIQSLEAQKSVLAQSLSYAKQGVETIAETRSRSEERMAQLIKEHTEELARYDAESKKHTDTIELVMAQGKELHSKIEAFKSASPVSTSDILVQIGKINEINAAVDAKATLEELRADYAKAEVLRASLEVDKRANVEQKKKDFQAKIAKAKLPDGLTVEETDLVMNRIPFEQVNTATKIRVSAQLALLSNPRLRLIHIERGESLTETSLSALKDLATELGCQMIIELACSAYDVETGARSPEVIIEDGYLGDALKKKRIAELDLGV